MTLSRREFVQLAAAMGASLAWGGAARASRTKWREARNLYPDGVASGDPDPTSVILWTRRPFDSGTRQLLTVEVSEDPEFRRGDIEIQWLERRLPSLVGAEPSDERVRAAAIAAALIAHRDRATMTARPSNRMM